LLSEECCQSFSPSETQCLSDVLYRCIVITFVDFAESLQAISSKLHMKCAPINDIVLNLSMLTFWIKLKGISFAIAVHFYRYTFSSRLICDIYNTYLAFYGILNERYWWLWIYQRICF